MKVSSKYTNFSNVFSPKLITKLLKYISINQYDIKLVDNLHFFYTSIYNSKLIELEILKVYIENNLLNSFIKSLKSFVRTLIFFN